MMGQYMSNLLKSSAPKQYLAANNCRSWCHVGALLRVVSRMLWLLYLVPELCVAKILESSQFFWGELS